jgi:3-oxoacyl-[acyl-carrier protein] reductase
VDLLARVRHRGQTILHGVQSARELDGEQRELEGRVALVTGGGRGIGQAIARELADAGMRVAVAARSAREVEATAEEIGGLAVTADVSKQDEVEAMVATVERELGPIDLLVNNAGIGLTGNLPWEEEPEDWWRIFEVNVLGAYLCSRAVLPGMVERGTGRIVNTGSGASYLPMGGAPTAYGASKAALGRFGELLAGQVADRGIAVFVISPGLVKTDMTSEFGDNLPWTPPELAPRLVRVLASGRADRLAGRYIHAEHDDIEDLIARADEISERDLNAIRLQR